MADFAEKDRVLIDYVEGLDEENVLGLSAEMLKEGRDPIELLDIINEGMKRVGVLYQNKEYYIADLIMAGLIFKGVLSMDMMKGRALKESRSTIGKVLLGTAKGDIHDIGKDIFRSLLETHRFEVNDLGVDVPKEQFIKKALEFKPDIIGLSGILTYTIDSMKEVIQALEEAGIRDSVKVIIGGEHITKEACEIVGADAYANDATDGLRICKKWVDG